MKKSFFTGVLCAVFTLVGWTSVSWKCNVSAATPSYVEAKAECVMEVNSRRILYEARGDLRLPMASTTKVLTAITVLELCQDISEEVVIPQEAVGIEGSSVYLKVRETYTVEDLLYGLMLRSGNDCATALALYCSGSVALFTSEMNKVAEKAGAIQSNFENPHGLPCKNHYTTARDLALITCYAMQNQTFAKIVSTQYYRMHNWKNKNKMLTLYEGGCGVKTGYTKEAGRCLVSAATRENMTLVCVVLNCPTTYERSTKLLDDAFEAYDYTRLLSVSQTFEVNARKGVRKQDFYYPLLEAEKDLIEIKTSEILHGGKGKKSQKIIGKIQIYLAKRLLFSGNLYKL